MSRVKIVTQRNGWTRLVVLLGVSLALVILTMATQPWTSYTRPTTTTSGGVVGGSEIQVGVIAVLLLLLPLLLVALSWSEQRWGYATLETLAVWLGTMIGTVSWTLLFPTFSPSLVDTLIPCLVLAVPYLLARIIGLLLVRFLSVSLAYQDGTLCSSCGYVLTGNISGVCPECGTPVPSERPDAEQAAAPRRRLPRMLIIAMIAAPSIAILLSLFADPYHLYTFQAAGTVTSFRIDKDGGTLLSVDQSPSNRVDGVRVANCVYSRAFALPPGALSTGARFEKAANSRYCRVEGKEYVFVRFFPWQ